MNLLEHYIEEVHNIEVLPPSKEDMPIWVKVDLTYDCWGCIERGMHITSKEAWERDLKRGYYLA